MQPENERKDTTFDQIGQDGRIARLSRMIAKDEPITDARKADIRARVNEYLKKHGLQQSVVARECQISRGTVSDVLRGKYGIRNGKAACDDTEYLRRLNNWMELDARRRNIVQCRDFVETSVAREIITVAEIVSETCKIGVVFGPARIGKSFTLAAIEGADRLGCPVLIRPGEEHKTPKSICRLICERFDLPTSGTFDVLSSRLIKTLAGTRRMLMFDEADRFDFHILEYIRDLHDRTECPILFSGKPVIYEKLGFRKVGEYHEVMDQLAGRIVIRRDLTERTRTTDNPQPLFSKDDIRALITTSKIQLKVSSDAINWLQDRACSIGMGGLDKVKSHLYLALKIALARGDAAITSEHLEAVEVTTIGHEDVERIETAVNESSGRKIRRLA